MTLNIFAMTMQSSRRADLRSFFKLAVILAGVNMDCAGGEQASDAYYEMSDCAIPSHTLLKPLFMLH